MFLAIERENKRGLGRDQATLNKKMINDFDLSIFAYDF